jgi:hypothetical protein
MSRSLSGSPANANTIFRRGSVSKSFVSVAIQMLSERKLVHLEDRISDDEIPLSRIDDFNIGFVKAPDRIGSPSWTKQELLF